MHQKRASVASQVVPQPLILSSMSRQDNNSSAVRNSASSSSSSLQRRSSLFKRDSAVSVGQAGARTDARRISMRRSFQSSEAAFVEDDLAEFLAEQPSLFATATDNMGPVYRLYPHQTASGRRDIRQASDGHTSPTATAPPYRPASRLQDHILQQQQQQRRPDQADVAYGAPHPNPNDTHSFSDHPTRPVTQDFQDRRQSSQPSSSRPLSPTSIFAKQYHASLSQPTSPSAGSEVPKTWTRNSIRIPPRTSSSAHNNVVNNITDSSINEILHRMPEAPRKSTSSTIPESEPTTPDAMTDPQYGDRSSRDSRDSLDTTATSVHTLPPLQNKGLDPNDAHALEPLLEDDPRSFDLVEPPQEAGNVGMYALEKQAELLLSKEHLTEIFNNSKLLLKFTGFLNSHRPQSIPLLIYYLDALKALRAIKYANAVAEALEPIATCDFTKEVAQQTNNNSLEEKANKAFEILVREDLPAYICYTWIQVVSTSISRRITGTLAPHLREASEGLAEVFCLTDPSRPDNPIVFASEEFSRTTQYGMGYSIGRNCRFLQGPRTDPNSPRRLAEACKSGVEQTEVFVNYRRDGSPFLNLLMIAPLMDSKGTVRYFIGAQVDVSGLLKSCSELPGLSKLVEEEIEQAVDDAQKKKNKKKDEFQELSEMFNGVELETVRRRGGSMHRDYVDNDDAESIKGGADRGRPRLMLSDPTQEVLDKQTERVSRGMPSVDKDRVNGKLAGVYQNYLLIRPAPSMRILFTSPSLRVPGILQSPFLHRIGGSPRVRADLSAALEEGRGVTAKIRWLARPDEDGEGEGRPRWIHCTPLIGHTGAVGVWMIVLIDEEGSRESISANRRFRTAPPVSTSIGGKDWEPTSGRNTGQERRQLNAYDAEGQRRGAGNGANAPNSANYFANPSNTNIHSSAASIDRRPSNGSLTGPLTSSREYPPSASQFSLHAGQRSPASSRAQSMTNRDGSNDAHISALHGHVASQMNSNPYYGPDNTRRDTSESQSFSVRTR